MVDHQSKEVVDKMSDELKIQPAMALPRKIVDSIQPVFNVNPERIVNFVEDAVTTTTGVTIMFTTPTDRDFFLTSANMFFQCDATADSTVYALFVTLASGDAVNLFRVRKLTLTATQDSLMMSYFHPIKLLRGSTINISHTFTVGASSIGSTITGYTTDPQ